MDTIRTRWRLRWQSEQLVNWNGSRDGRLLEEGIPGQEAPMWVTVVLSALRVVDKRFLSLVGLFRNSEQSLNPGCEMR